MTPATPLLSAQMIQDFHEQGFVRVNQVFTPQEMDQIDASFDRMRLVRGIEDIIGAIDIHLHPYVADRDLDQAGDAAAVWRRLERPGPARRGAIPRHPRPVGG